jgi:hypothetical protein
MDNNFKVLLVAKDSHLYFFDALTEIDVISGNQLKESTLSGHKADQLSRYQLIIFMDSGFQPEYARIVKKYSSARLILFFWNKLSEKRLSLLAETKIDGVIDDYYSFDPIEAKKFGLLHNSTFYKSCIELSSETPKYDLFFGGNNKGRRELAYTLESVFGELGLSLNLFIVEGNEGYQNTGYLSYSKFLEFLSPTNGILEIMQNEQHGLTLRTMEALFFKKKLVTTNHEIKRYYFYHPDNIFILGHDALEELPAFMNKAHKELDTKMIQFFEPKSWIQRFFHKDQLEENNLYFNQLK